ncbi:MAG: hypothetical protein JW738_07790 [Actinobacteria bacterium]|nr:hypothetical protein [Actinomycetota bacterium]
MHYSIHVVTDIPDLLNKKYLISHLASYWELAGHQITMGLADNIDTDIGILHIDLTRIDKESLPKNPFHRPFLNGRVLDISKSRFSTLKLLPRDNWDGPVIIKSIFNFYGDPEWRNNSHGFPERIRRKLSKKSWRLARRLPPHKYPVLSKLSDVPGWVWENPELIVERFMPERERGFYCMRGWLFFGKRGYTYKMLSENSVVKAGNITEYRLLGDPPPELEEFREANGFDFGKFDYVEHDGRPILLDINKTPTIVSSVSSGVKTRMQYLAEGLLDFTEVS